MNKSQIIICSNNIKNKLCYVLGIFGWMMGACIGASI